MPKELAPYLIALLAIALMVRRTGRSRTIRLGRLWIAPVLIGLAASVVLLSEPMPGALVFGGYLLAAGLGIGAGYLRAQHQHLTVDPATGGLSARTTPIGMLVVVAIFAARFGLKLVLPQQSAHWQPGSPAAHAADALLLFAFAMVTAQAVTLRSRAKPLLAAAATKP